MFIKTSVKWITTIILFIFVTCVFLYLFGKITSPKYTDIPEGNLISEYYDDVEANVYHQVVFIGDCEVYESFSPPVLWEKYGISSYVRGSASQTIWQSYYLLEETLKYECPNVVVVNVLSMKYDKTKREEYNRMTIDGMKMSSSKVKSIIASMSYEESFLSYLFPIFRYHSRIPELNVYDFKYAFERPGVSFNGYLMQKSICGRVETYEEMTEEAENIIHTEKLPDICFEYLEKIKDLCFDNGIELILVKSPTNSPGYWWYDEWDVQIKEFAQLHELDYYNFINDDELSIDWETDTYDGGVHLNLYGAEKLSIYFGKILSEKYGIKNLGDDREMSGVWEKKTKKYEAEKYS